MKIIVVPVDFSEASFRAALFAAQLAAGQNSRIDLIHGVELGHEKLYQPFTLHEKYNNLILEDHHLDLREFRGRLLESHPHLELRTHLFSGNPAEGILKYSRENSADMIVVGNTGSGMAARVLFGSVAADLISKTSFPVIAVPPVETLQLPETIVFATSHFEENREVLQPVMDMAEMLKANVRVVNYLHAEEIGPGEYMEKVLKADNYSERLHKMFPGLPIEVEIIEGKTLVQAMDEYIDRQHAGMLVLVPYARTLLEKFRSTTRKMTFHSHIPVLILPPGEARQPAMD